MKPPVPNESCLSNPTPEDEWEYLPELDEPDDEEINLTEVRYALAGLALAGYNANPGANDARRGLKVRSAIRDADALMQGLATTPALRQPRKETRP